MQALIVFRFFDVIVLLGSVQAGIIALLLLARNTGKAPARLFSLNLLTLAALALKIELHTLGLWDTPAFRYFPLAIDTLLPVLLYTYLRAVTGRPLKFRQQLLYLLPFLLFLSHALLVYFLTLPQTVLATRDALAEKWRYNTVKDWEDRVTMIMAVISWVASYRELSKYRSWLYSTQSDSRLEAYAWLKKLLLLSGVLALTFAVSTWLFRGRFDILEGFYIYLAGISYYLALKGYDLYSLDQEEPLALMPELPEPATLSADQRSIIEKIDMAFSTERLYLQPELSLKDLAAHIGYPAGIVSAAINQGFAQNFRNLVNARRVEAVQEMLKAPPAHLSLLGIALECGFNSEASFYRVFRQFTGMSPNDYLQKINAQNRF